MNGDNFNVVKKRKQRTMHNPMTNVDSVNEAAGQGYVNWIVATREKLRERESNLLSIRMDLVKRVIYDTIEEFNNDIDNISMGVNISMKYLENLFETVNDNLVNECIAYLTGILSHWNGIDLTRSTKQFTTFRKYFVVSKNWFDHRKKCVLTQHFWYKILSALQQFCAEIASNVSNITASTEYSQYLLFKLLYAIFSSKTQFSSTKPQPLIPGGTVKDTADIKQFLKDVDSSLALSTLANNINNNNNTNNNQPDISAKQTLQVILNQLQKLCVEYENRFHSSLANVANTTELKTDLDLPYNNNVNNCSNHVNHATDVAFVDNEYAENNNWNENNFYFNNCNNVYLNNNCNQNTSTLTDFSSNDYTPNHSPLMAIPANNINHINDINNMNNMNANAVNTRISNPFLPNVNKPYESFRGNNNSNNNNNNFVNEYGPVHASNVCVSANRHSPLRPLDYYQHHEVINNNINTNNYQCTCNCHLFI